MPDTPSKNNQSGSTESSREQDNTGNRGSHADAGQGADEQQTESYKQYGKGAEQSATPSGAASISGVGSSATKQADTLRKSVLCIEDEHFITELYTRALVKAGYNVTNTSSGEKGLQLARTNDFDVILLDIMIPELLGVEVLHRLRAEMPSLKSKIIITTNLEQDDQTREAIEREADGYLIKAEITPKQLVEFLNNLKF